MKLTRRSKIRICYTTCPADMGYDGRKTDWKSEFILCGMKQAMNFAAKLKQEIGSASYAISYSHRGRDISIDQIREVVYLADHADLY